MDEHKLADLFRDAVRDAPPASFDEGDVRAASQRATVRRRTALALGTSTAAVVLVAGSAVGFGVFGSPDNSSNTTASAPAAGDNTPRMTPFDVPGPKVESQSGDNPQATDHGGLPPKSVPESSPLQGGDLSGSVSPRADGTPRGCGPVDRELAVALAGELPAAAGHQPVPVDGTCPTGSKAAGYVVRDGQVGGLFWVIVVPKSSKNEAQSAELDTTPGSRVASLVAQSGSTLYVVSEPAQGSSVPPFGSQVDAVAGKLAGKY
ncbi:MAG TPA: hypothetical protein VGP03_11035 [Pseudonocardiaceae bacterium]|nr:hypothetical protein [Pseudonocardiaceae bacterium]